MTQSLEYANFWQRLTAFMLDVFIIFLPVFTFVLSFTTPIFFDVTALKSSGNQEFEIIYQLYKNGVYISLAGFAAVSFVLALFAISRWQATPGKRIVNIYIARKNGTKISFADAFGRFISLPLFLLMVQIFERRENYAALDELKRGGKISTDFSELQTHLNGPAAQITSIVVLAVLFLWFSKIFLCPERTAMHDILFNTRVFKGKK